MMDWIKKFLSAAWSKVTPVLANWQWYVWAGVGLLLFGMIFGGCVGGCVVRTWDRWFPPATGNFGWIDDKPAQKAVLATMRVPYFSQVMPRQFAEKKTVLLWDAAIKVTGGHLPAHDQDGTGCCVGEGWARAVNYLQCVEIALNGEAASYKPISSAAVYSLSREVGGLLGRGDGSFGSAAAKAVTTLGVVSCDDAKDDPTSGTPHGQLAKKWGGRAGLPQELKELAKKHTVKTASMVQSANEIAVAIQNGYPVAICSDVGFEPFRRDSEGFCRPGGSWPHCMMVSGYRADRDAFCIDQSWGASTPPGPTSLNQPLNSFWISRSAMERIARQEDSYALSSFDGFPAQNLDFFVSAPRQRDWRRPTITLALAP